MRTNIVCPKCEIAHLQYHKHFYPFSPKWICPSLSCGLILFPPDFETLVRTQGVVVHSVNYPYPLLITDKSAEAAV